MKRSPAAAAILIGSLAFAVTACTNAGPDPMKPNPPPLDFPKASDAGAPLSPTVAVPEADLKALVEGNNEFAVSLYKKLAEKETGNIVISPYSISAALAMTSAGARGQTANEMAKVLGLTGLGDRAHPAHAALARELRRDGKGGPEFLTANALWGQRGLPFRDEFLRLTREHYEAGLREVDFAGNTDGARRTINRWVGEQTKEKVPELLKPNDLGPESKLVLTNAVYFKADWTFPFNKEQTKDGPFRVSREKTVTVPLMKQTAQLRYAEGDSAQIVELPYSGGSFSMLVVLPVKPEGMGRAEAAVVEGELGRWMTRAAPRQVDLTLPKFRLRAVATLGSPLETLGMTTAFTPAADFTGLVPTGGLRITRVVHEACIEVDEQGTEAAAATAVVAGKVRLVGARMVADRPFLVLIRDTASGATLFIGRVMNPNSR